MSTLLPELPALPQSAYWWSPKDGSGLSASLACWSTNSGPHPAWDVKQYFTADQVRAIQLEAWKAAIEAAAKEAKDRAEQVRRANTYRGRVSNAAIFVADQLEFLASRLRSLPSPE